MRWAIILVATTFWCSGHADAASTIELLPAIRLGNIDRTIGPWEGILGTCSEGRVGTTMITAKHCSKWTDSTWTVHESADVTWKGGEPDWDYPQLGEVVHGVSYPAGVRTPWVGVVAKFYVNEFDNFVSIHSDTAFCMPGASGTVVINSHNQPIGVLDRGDGNPQPYDPAHNCQVDIP